MNKIIIPKTFMGKPIEGSLERVLEGLNKNSQNPPQTQHLVNAPNLSGYIFVPSINLYVAKQRSHLGLDWDKTHEELQKESLKMPTIPQFFEHIKFLQNDYSDKNEAQIILDDILKIGNWRREHLDAYFEKRKDGLYILTENKFKSEKLDCPIIEDCYVNLKFNHQGMPIEKSSNQNYVQGKNIYFYYPRNSCVARFIAYSDRAYFNCSRDADDSGSSLGVFACAEGASPKI